MRILVFSNLPPYVIGGAENQVARLVSVWLAAGHHVVVAGHRLPGDYVWLNGLRVQTHRIRTVACFGRLGRATSYLISTLMLLSRIRGYFDIIYCRGMGDAAMSICLAKMVKISNLPPVACPINAKGKGDATFIRSIPGWPLIVQMINRQCNAINLIAQAIMDDLNDLHIRVPTITAIPNGIPVQPFREVKKTGERKRMVFTGRLSHQKGLDLLISALHELYGLGYRFELDIIGTGPMKEELMRKIDTFSLGNYIRLKGQMAVTEIRDTLIQYDLLVLPSRYEGMSNSALEAMEAGIPAMVTRCGGIDHYIDTSNGWVCEPDDPESIKTTLKSVMDTPSKVLRKMGRSARRTVRQHFDIELIARNNLTLFESVLQQGHKRNDNLLIS